MTFLYWPAVVEDAMTPERMRALVEFSIEVGIAPDDEPIPDFILRLAGKVTR